MSTLIVGLSHYSAPFEILERVALGPEAGTALVSRLRSHDDISEVVVLATCNRVEVVVEAETFHGALHAVGEQLSTVTGVGLDTLSEHLYVHYEDRAVCHLFELACGLDSLAVGESQVLGQLRGALAAGQQTGDVGPVLNPLLQQALRVGKKAHAVTDIDVVARSLVGLGLEHAARVLSDLSRARAVVIGAGAVSGLALAILGRAGVSDLTVVNRTRLRATRLAGLHEGRVAEWSDLGQVLSSADLVVSCTGSTGHVLPAGLLAHARADRADPVVVLDLALPRDVAPETADQPGVHLWSLADLQGDTTGRGAERTEHPAVREVRDLVTAEVAAYLTQRREQRVAPTVAALRARAGEVVDLEYARLMQRLPGLGQAEQAEVRRTVQRVVDKLLHTPTVRVKTLQSGDGAGDYANALRELFDLDPREVTVVSTPPASGPEVTP
ncbi:MAG: glutamyl-tRNA reductase [Actinobacteria bacterium]|nr:glutamyl-tRNA reductase [Actinomycetota bacterium]